MIGRFFGTRGAFLMTFVLVTLTLLGASVWVISFVWGQVRGGDDIVIDEALSEIYVNYYDSAENYVSPESYLAMAAYQRDFPQPQNVQVLVGSNTQEVIGYMLNHISAGMGVNCTHCHSLQNFAADEWDDPVAMQNKVTARQHLTLVQELNQQWLPSLVEFTDLKQPSGVQATCTICHNGAAVPEVWPANQEGVPDNFRLPLEAEFTVEGEELLNVNARRDISLDTVAINQNVMYHMNTSLGVGCTHCHNSRYFPSWEVPAKYYSIHMLQMSQFIWERYGDSMNGTQPSCNMCHQGAPIPPGAARSPEVLPPALTISEPGN